MDGRAAKVGRLLPVVFFASGAASLIDQVIWQRMLAVLAGTDVFATTIVVAAFMGGLGCGSLAGGYLADRVGRRTCLAVFAAAESGIAVFGFASSSILYDWLYIRLGTVTLSHTVVWLLAFGILLWPTLLMGVSLPMLARALPDDARRPSGWVSRLYGWNTVGAASGAFCTAWVLFRIASLTQGLRIAAAINLGCAACAWGIAAGRRSPVPRDPPQPIVPPSGFSFSTWMALALLSGFMALSLELVWFRVIGVLVKSTAFSFGSLLALYLFFVGTGALATETRWLRVSSPATAFLALQTAIIAYAIGALALLVATVGQLRFAGSPWWYLGGYEPAGLDSRLWLLTMLYGIVPALLMGPPTLMMGMSFGYLQQGAQTDVRAIGRRVGALQAANIVGSVLGTIVTGLALLHWAGASGTLRILAVLGAVFGVTLAVTGRFRAPTIARVGVAVAATGLAVAIVPSEPALWAALHGASEASVIVAEDRSGVSLLKRLGDGSTVVFANGIGQSWLPFGDTHTVLGALPALIHPSPGIVAVIGLGSGDTAFGATCRVETRHLYSVEVVAPERTTLETLNNRHTYPGLAHVLKDSRIHHVFADGREVIRTSGQRYDIIEADALRPTGAYAGRLYSLEYFELMRAHLADGGLGVTWAPTARVRHTFIRAFPYVLQFGDILIGSARSIGFDAGLVKMRALDAYTRRHFEDGGMDVQALLAPFLNVAPIAYGPEFDRSMLIDVNEDLFPRDEFMVPQPRLRLPGDEPAGGEAVLK